MRSFRNVSACVVAVLLSLTAVADVGASPKSPREEAPTDAVYRVPVAGLPSLGDARALVTVVAFTDYECSYCRAAERTLARLRAEFGADVRVVVAELPLPMHPRARPAALAALAADRQGHFEAMRARLWASHETLPSLDDSALAAAAVAAGLDMARFTADRGSEDVARSLTRSEGLASTLGVRGTPTFFVNGRRIAGNQPYETFASLVNDRLAAARSLVASGTSPTEVYDVATRGGLEHVSDGATGEGCGHDDACAGHDDAPSFDPSVVSVPTFGDPSRGPADAPITIVELADFECPYCARAETTVQALEQAHPGQVRVIWKQRPLPMHPHARLAAAAALAAGAQGHFWEYHDLLFAHPEALDRASLESYAAQLGLDATTFASALVDPAIEGRIQADAADADALQAKGTPTFFVNGHRVVGAQPLAAFEAAIAAPHSR